MTKISAPQDPQGFCGAFSLGGQSRAGNPTPRRACGAAGQAAAADGSAASSVPSASGGFGNGAFQAAIRLGRDATKTKIKKAL